MNTHFEVAIKNKESYITINFNGKCNYIKDIFGDFIAFMNRDEEDHELLLRVIHKDQIIQIENVGTED